jgi:membrane protein YdbS with pleckstrin-like domain
MTGERGSSGDTRRRDRGAPPGADPVAPAAPGSAETVVARMHSSARVLVLPAVAVIAVCAAAGYFSGNLPESWENAALPFAAGFLVLVIGVLPLLLWASRVYVVTTHRVVERRGLFSRRRQELPHSRSGEVVVRRGPLQILARSGDVVVAGRGGEEFVLRDVPDAVLVRQTLADLMLHGSGMTAPRSRQPEATRRPFDP